MCILLIVVLEDSHLITLCPTLTSLIVCWDEKFFNCVVLKEFHEVVLIYTVIKSENCTSLINRSHSIFCQPSEGENKGNFRTIEHNMVSTVLKFLYFPQDILAKSGDG